MQLDLQGCELLREIARLPRDPSEERLHELLTKIRDWDSTVKAAREHGILTMLYRHIAHQSPPIPERTMFQIRSEFESSALNGLTNAVELLDVLEAFNKESIPAMPFKGVVLGASVYGDLMTRPAGDLDLLIFPDDLKKATSILQQRGYQLTTATREDGSPAIENYYEYHFERESDGRVIELRWRLELTQPRFRRNLGMDWIWPRRRTTTLAGAEVPDMDPVIGLLVLCMHGSKHRWSRLIWICDVARFVFKQTSLDWNRVEREAKRSGLWKPLALGVLLASRIGSAPVPEPVLKRFASDRAVNNLAQHFDQSLFHDTFSAPGGRLPYHVQLLGASDRARLLLSIDFLRPNDRDLASVRLPKLLYPLYYLIRPFRIIVDRSPR